MTRKAKFGILAFVLAFLGLGAWTNNQEERMQSAFVGIELGTSWGDVIKVLGKPEVLPRCGESITRSAPPGCVREAYYSTILQCILVVSFDANDKVVGKRKFRYP